jgi:hypothetical protein
LIYCGVSDGILSSKRNQFISSIKSKNTVQSNKPINFDKHAPELFGIFERRCFLWRQIKQRLCFSQGLARLSIHRDCDSAGDFCAANDVCRPQKPFWREKEMAVF